MDFKWVETTHQLHFWAKDGSNFFRFFSTMMARKVLMVMNHFANRIERGSNMEQPAFCLFWPSRRIPCPLSRRWNERSWFETRTIKPTIKPHVWKYHQISHELSNYVWNPRFWRSLFLFHRIWWFLFRFLNHTNPCGSPPLHGCGILRVVSWRPKRKLKLRRWAESIFDFGNALWSAYCLKKNIILGQLLGTELGPTLGCFGRSVLDPFFFLMRFLRTKSTKPVRNVFFLCDFDRRSRDEKMNAEKRRERRSAKKSSKKKNDSSSSTRSSCSFSSIFGWRCFFSGSRIGVSFLVELSKVVVPN